jgi:putative membrane-bound dehydrogenase-like protein
MSIPRSLLFLPSVCLLTQVTTAGLHPAGQAPVADSSGATGNTAAKPLWSSHVVTQETVGHAVEIDVDLRGATKLYLVVTDSGNGFMADWSAWMEPRLTGAYGEKKLTDVPWVNASSQWGKVEINKNAQGQPIIVNGQPVANGIGTHANSVIEYNLPAGTMRFKAKGGLDKGGTDQGATSVVFQVWTTAPAIAAPKPGGGAKEPVDALAALNVADGLEVATFAAEPLLLSPSSIDIDSRGRVWVAEIVNYRGHAGKRPEGDRILILEDTNGDGVAEKQTVFYQGKDVISPHGVCVLGNQCIVSAGDKVLRLTDTDGDDKSDKTEVLFTGIQGAQHDHGIHAFHFGPDGKLYFNFGNAGLTLKDKDGQPVKDMAGNIIAPNRTPYQEGCVFRCNPDLTEIETVGWNFRNNWECNVDSFGSIWQSDNDDDGNKSVRINFVMEFGNYGYKDELTGNGWQKGDAKTEEEVQAAHFHQTDPGVMPNLLQTGAGSPTGILVYEGDLLPKEFQGQMIHCDAGPNIVRSYPVTKSGGGYKATVTDILHGTRDSWFRPSDVCVAPDGSLLVADWYDPGVGGHGMGDLERGRIYRVAPAAALGKYPSGRKTVGLPTAGAGISQLLSPNEATRYLGWQVLKVRGDDTSTELKKEFTTNPNPRFRARALWAWGKLTSQGTQAVDAALADKDDDIRVTGLRLARQLKLDLIPLITKLAKDPSAAVRREALIGLRFLTSPEAAKLWAQLAAQHDGADKWYLAACSIGANLNWDACFTAYMDLMGEKWNTAGGRDLIWISRATKSADYIAQILSSNLPAADKMRFVRALDYQASEEQRQSALKQLLTAAATPDADPAASNRLVMEVIKHVKDFDFAKASAPVKTAVAGFLKGNRDSKEYFAFLDRFTVPEEKDHLMETGLTKAGTAEAVSAVKILLKMDMLGPIVLGIGMAADDKVGPALETLSLTQNKEAAVAILALLKAPNSSAVMKSAGVKALGKSRNGENVLLEAVKKNELPGDLKLAAGEVLNASTDVGIKKAASELLPMPTGQDNKPLPPISKLIARKGDTTNGHAVYAKICIACHKVNDEGIDFGPALSEIGSKLPKEALYASIIDPNAAISFGFEGWEVKTKKGDTYVGMVAGETDSELSLKTPGGIVVKTPKAEITERKKLPISLMPPGLHATISEQELVDLVEYLSGLRKK